MHSWFRINKFQQVVVEGCVGRGFSMGLREKRPCLPELVFYHISQKLWERLWSRDHSCLKTEVWGKQGHAPGKN